MNAQQVETMRFKQQQRLTPHPLSAHLLTNHDAYLGTVMTGVESTEVYHAQRASVVMDNHKTELAVDKHIVLSF